MTTAVVALAFIAGVLAFVVWKAWRGGRAAAERDQAKSEVEAADEAASVHARVDLDAGYRDRVRERYTR